MFAFIKTEIKIKENKNNKTNLIKQTYVPLKGIAELGITAFDEISSEIEK